MAEEEEALFPALWTASADGRVEDVRRLLAEGADIEGRGGPQQCTPLCAAAEGGHRVVSLILLFSAAEVSAKDIGGGTAMHYAASKGHAAVVLLLLEHGAGVNSKDNYGRNALYFALLRNHEAVFLALLEHGAHPELAELFKAEAVRKAKCEAFAMGQLERLGAGSPVRELEAGVLAMVLEQVYENASQR